MFFKSSFIQPMNNEQLLKAAPAVFASNPHADTSNKYLFIPTHKLVDGLRSTGWEVVSASQTMNKASSREAADTNKHALFFARQDSIGKSFNSQDVLPLIKMENSHNGLSSFSLSSGFFRKVCANGLTIPESIYAAPKVKHTVNLANDVIEATYKVLKDFPLLMDMQKELSGLILTEEEKFLLSDAAADIFFEQDERKALNQIARSQNNERYLLESQIVAPVRWADKKNDLWTISNVIQENLIRGNVRVVNAQNRLVSKRKVTSIQRDNDIHSKLFMLTQKFAEIKGVKIGSMTA